MHSVTSDHRLLVCTLFKRYAKDKSPRAKPPDFSTLQNPEMQRLFSKSISVPPCSLSLEEQYSLFAKQCADAAATLPRKEPTPRRQFAWLTVLDAEINEISRKVRAISKDEVDAYAAAISFSRQDELDRALQQYAKLLSQNPRLAWSHISSTKRGQRSPQLTASSPQERNEKYTTHFHNLLSPSVSNTPVVFASHSNSNLIYNTGPITIQEYNIALNSCHNGKATGLDHIPTEVLRVAEVKQFALQILNAALVQGATPKMMRTTALVPLWKRKGTIDEAGNFRGIALMSHLSKLYDKILLLRLRSCIDALLLPVQNGFRQRRGTVHHVLALRRLHDIASTFQDFPIHAIFVDFAKAFDSVYFEATKSALRAWNVPPTLEKAIFSVIEEHEIHVRSDGIVGPPITVTAGVLQGDTLAPFLFVLVLDAVLRSLPPELGICTTREEHHHEPQRELRKRSKPVSKYIHMLAYADDLVLLSSSCANVQRMLHILQENALKVGLKLNFGKNKTEYIALGRTKPEGVADLSGIQLTKTTLYRYLGCFPMDATADMDARIKKTWAALKSLEGVWQSSCSIDIKRKLFFSLCEPILGYGLLAFPQTIRQTQALMG